MATFQTLSDKPLPGNNTLFVGNTFVFKVVPARGELVPFKMSFSAPKIVSLAKDDVRVKPNFEIYTLKADKVGSVSVTAQNAQGSKVGPVVFNVKAPLTLPAANTDAGALTRLLLAEAPSPFAEDYDSTNFKTGMHWMRLVVENRLAMASSQVGSAGAKTRIDVIKSPGQFKGFEQYPTIASGQSTLIDEIVALANKGGHPKQDLFYKHVVAAIAVPTEPMIADPCPTKLLGWRTAGASSPGGSFTLYKTFSGQDFYTIK
jgi:hypothetical protein